MFVSNNKARILHLRASQFVGGPERQILHHAATAASPEREVWIGSFRDGPIRPELLQCAEQMGLSTFELSSGRFDPRTIFELARRLRHNEISLLCTHGYKANIVGWAASRLTGCPQIAFVRGWTGESWRVQLYDRLDRLVLRWTDWVVCVSHAQAKELREKRKGRHAPVVIANAALLPREEVNPPIHRLRIRRALGLREDAFLVCAVGRLSPEKGHPTMDSGLRSARQPFTHRGRAKCNSGGNGSRNAGGRDARGRSTGSGARPAMWCPRSSG